MSAEVKLIVNGKEYIANNIDELVKMQKVIQKLIKATFINEYCVGCSLGLSFPSGKCKGCKTLTQYGLSLKEVHRQ
jgi:hypothetical protein